MSVAELTTAKLDGLAPCMLVTDMESAKAFYLGTLGFQLDFEYGDPVRYAGISRDGIKLHLSNMLPDGRNVGQSVVYFFIDDVDTYFAEINSRGAGVLKPPTVQHYGLKDFDIKDPAGNLLSFGQEVE